MILFQNKIAGKIVCCHCHELIDYDSKFGTGTLTKHLSKCPKYKKIPNLFQYAKRAAPVPNHAKEKILEAACFSISHQLQSFRSIEDPGFLNFCNELMKFSEKNPGYSASDLLPDRKKVSKQMSFLEKKFIGEQIQRLEPLAKKDYICYSADMWTSSCNKEKYLDISCHYTDSDFNIVSEQLKLLHFPEAHTHENIISRIEPVLESISQTVKTSKFVTDAGANIKKAIEEMSVSYRCLCHKFNTAIETGFKDAIGMSQNFKDFDSAVTNLITYVNKSEMNNGLPIRLKSGGTTRPWRHLYDKYYGVLRSYDSLRECLEKVIDFKYFQIIYI